MYLMKPSTMNTFSRNKAEKLVRDHNMSIRNIISLPVDTLPNIIEKYNSGVFPDILSLDAEGLDLDILKTIDYKCSYPKIICVETVSFATRGRGKKDMTIINFLQEQDYILHADTYINSIFVRRSYI